jgi:DNA repair protein RadA/Sms
VSVAGGLNLREPAADLAISLAIVSSVKNKPLPQQSAALGELGLLGEIRPPSFLSKRLKEARKLGYKVIIGEKEKDLRQTLKYLR